jgi:dTDP-4-dehydrorhamnose reductase
MNRSVLVLGCTGMLGHKLMHVLQSSSYQVHGTTRSASASAVQKKMALGPNAHIISEVDVDSILKIDNLVAELKPVAIVNCVGLIKQLPDAKKAVPSIKINALFPNQMAELADRHETRLIHFSTDCVYSGTKGFYNESDPTDPQDLYGKSKALGEVSGPGCLTIRSSIIGPELETQLGLFEWFYSRRGQKVKGYEKVLYTGLSTLEISKLVLNLIENFPKLTGIYNVASEPISKLEILKLINEKLKLGTEIIPDSDVVLDRTLNGAKFRELTGYRTPSWSDMIQQMVSDDEIRGRR